MTAELSCYELFLLILDGNLLVKNFLGSIHMMENLI